MKNIESISHITGKSLYVDDIPEIYGTVYAVPIFSDKAHARILNVDSSKLKYIKGIVEVLTADDIPGENQIGGIIADEPLLAKEVVNFIGQPIAVVVAETREDATKASKLIEIEYDELEVITDAREAAKKGQFLFPSRTFANGNTNNAFDECDHVFYGRVDSGAQEHIYMETQGSYAIPTENKSLKIISSTQGPTAVQKTVASILNLPMHNIEVDVKRLGGGFGGKEDQATPWAALAALVAYKLDVPVKLILDRQTDIKITGKRHPYSSDFKIGLTRDLKIKALEIIMYQNGGAASDLSPAIMERSLFHIGNSYFIPNLKATAHSCKTNIPPSTAFRGFGAPQAVFVVESALSFAAEKLSVDKIEIQRRNLLKKGDEFHYGQICDSDNAMACIDTLNHSFNLDQQLKKIDEFNAVNIFRKKGLAITPSCFGISFTNTSMNQARVLVHIYQDGSIGISTGAVEMGQGVNTKMSQVAAEVFSVNTSRIRIESTNTTRVANTSPTAASSGADLNGHALKKACEALLQRLKQKAAEELNEDESKVSIVNEQILINGKLTVLDWQKLIKLAMLGRVKLSETSHYATPIIYFDKEKEKGHPFAYHVFGVSAVSVEIDCITGRYNLEKVSIVHDFGKSMNEDIDLGQIEGGLLQGLGWMTMEEIKWDEKGKMMADSLSKYKIPDMSFAPTRVDIKALDTKGHELAILKSKAVGEPPFLYGIAVYFALQKAIKSFNIEYSPKYDAPLTPEKVLRALYEKT